ncbi:MAG: DNA-3-methyladenine glycosylase I [Gammaproteobacteria bacterium]|nr:DNA-3-methyladenine glycosylase I [Gammaproteobacteria bacterium]MDH5650672.1 DNA-3-methyladenine glycosylase I [Gammaproteobacteria bacterium]
MAVNEQRCVWCGTDPLYVRYHDKEWGVPVFSERKLFEMLTLEGAQAGLSWITVLKKRSHYKKVFDNFDIERIARYNQRKVDSLLNDAGIIRNRLKIESTISNARVWLALKEQGIKPKDLLWQFVDGEPVQNNRRTIKQVPATTPHSDAMSKELKKRGFRFVGSTICYAFMQAVGMVNDHTVDCFRHSQLK